MKTSAIIVGLGKTGYSCARFLAQKGVDFRVVDTREKPPCLQALKDELPEVKVSLGPLNGDLLSQARVLYVSPGIAKDEPAIAQAVAGGTQLSSDIDLFCQATKAPVVAITGSNAKSTVTSLVGLMAQKSGKKTGVGGNLGTPVLELLAQGDHELYVIELSSFQLEITSHLEAEVATVLNISPDHLDRYIDLEEYRQAKHRIFHNCHQIVVNVDDPQMPAGWPSNKANQAKTWRFGMVPSDHNTFGVMETDKGLCLAFDGQPLMAANDMKIKGNHNVCNALAALAIGTAIDLPMATMLAALSEFPGLKHRGQWLARIEGVDYYNDSKGTNVGATVAALRGLGGAIDGKIVLIAGGQGKGSSFDDLGEPVRQLCRGLVLIGEEADAIARVVQQNDLKLPLVNADSMEQAVQQARKLARPGDLVLLSPACASFDMFNNFEHRGDVFIETVQTLAAEASS